MTAMDKIRKLIDAHPEHLLPSARTFEQLYRCNPDDSGYRRVYFELSRRVGERYPLKRPEWIDPPNDDYESPEFEQWATTDPCQRWSDTFDRITRERGSVNGHMYVYELQQAGKDII